jgi:hypothetical protein
VRREFSTEKLASEKISAGGGSNFWLLIRIAPVSQAAESK